MKNRSLLRGIQVGVFSVLTLALSACVEIKSDAKVGSDAKVHFTTTYDVSRIVALMQANGESSTGDMAKSLSCEKMNERLTKEYSCKDLGVGKFAVSGEFEGMAENGVTIDKDKNQIAVDTVSLFKKVVDLNPSKQSVDANLATAAIQKGLVPVAVDQAAYYKQMGMSLVLNITMPANVLTVDGAEAKDIKENTVVVNFIDIAGKDGFVVTSKLNKNRIWGKLIFVLLAIAAIAAAVLYLLKRKKNQTPKPTVPSTPSGSIVETDKADETAQDLGASAIEQPSITDETLKDGEQVPENKV